MTAEEFVKKVNGLSKDERELISARADAEHNVFIFESFPGNTVSKLPNSSRSWHFYGPGQHNLPACVLKLMAELANDEYWGKFLILNGEPEDSFCNFFLIGDDGQLYPRCEENLDELVKFACTKEELDELKEGFSQRMQEAIDVLAVPFSEVASKMEED